MILIAELISHYVNGNVNMAKIKKAQVGTKLTPARTRQVADSLSNEAERKRYQAASLSASKNVPQSVWETQNKRLMRGADADEANAKRYRSLADKAEGKKPEMKKGGKVMLKRKDGSYSQRGLWDNIRAAKGSGKKPTAAMLKQERKIKAKSKK